LSLKSFCDTTFEANIRAILSGQKPPEPEPEAIATLLSTIQTILTPDEYGDLAAKYDAAFQRNPSVVLTHADVIALLATNISGR
jgi:hypothetical protein